MLKFKIIDSFSVKEGQPGGMKSGWWFIADGELLEEGELPALGSTAILKRPSGSPLEVKICGYDLRHAKKRVFGFQLVGLTNADVPRLSELSLQTNGERL